MSNIFKKLVQKFTFRGTVQWIGVRPAKLKPMVELQSVWCSITGGLAGDRYSGGANGTRMVTLFQKEHLDIIAGLMQQPTIRPEQMRRNIAVSGINLQSLRDQQFQIGEVILQGTGLCQPCSRMETTIGKGGYAAMSGHGGLTATVIREGQINVGDQVLLCAD